MRRKSVVLSLPSFILLAILFSTLGLDYIRNGGRAFSPGELSARNQSNSNIGGYTSHFEFENQCSRCHQPLSVRQAELCMDCHTEVAGQVKSAYGSHGAILSVLECYECHSDHEGEEFDPIQEAMEKFDHSIATFSLRWHQEGYDTLPMHCDTCHTTSPRFGFITASCQQCHSDHQPEFMAQHLVDFGMNCTDCHDGKDQMVDFDHQSTMFPLEGKHLEARCADCHLNWEFENTPVNCNECHSEPLVHINQFDPNCSTCHDAQAWKPALLDGEQFDHDSASGFSLVRHRFDYSGEILACQNCHSQYGYEARPETCIACHANEAPEFIEGHILQFGDSCLECHDGVDRMSEFDHASRFSLLGRHAEIECESCHVEKVFRGTPAECDQCHAEPEIHAGFFGFKCQYCHTEISWIPAKIRLHVFPLDHGRQPDLDCRLCHDRVYQEYTCYGCHDHRPEAIAESHQNLNISIEELQNCSTCHLTGENEAADE
jgi:hypothetical protein